MQVPPALLRSLEHVKGFDREAFEQVHRSGETVTSVRLNCNKSSAGDGGPGSFLPGSVYENVPWHPLGYYLPSRPSFTGDPLFHCGGYYVQEASSMFLHEAFRQATQGSGPLRVLDLCAAPGGKSTLLQCGLPPGSLLVSNEVIKTRVPVLVENITKWGATNVIVTNNDPRDFQRLPGFFDMIVVDAPCSGSGLFRKDPLAANEWSERNVEMCSGRQQRILADVLPALKPGGCLIYSTCSFSPEEDEAICDWLISAQGLSTVRCKLPPDWKIVESNSPVTNGYGYRFFPDKLRGEGFYIAVFQHAGHAEVAAKLSRAKSRAEMAPGKELAPLAPWLNDPGAYFYFKHDNELVAFPAQLEAEFSVVRTALYLKKAGTRLGSVIRGELIPAHELAMSTLLDPRVSSVDVDLEMALRYLRKQEVHVPGAKGWTLLRYKQLALGWIKGLGNRSNNYYPAEWRILNK